MMMMATTTTTMMKKRSKSGEEFMFICAAFLQRITLEFTFMGIRIQNWLARAELKTNTHTHNLRDPDGRDEYGAAKTNIVMEVSVACPARQKPYTLADCNPGTFYSHACTHLRQLCQKNSRTEMWRIRVEWVFFLLNNCIAGCCMHSQKRRWVESIIPQLMQTECIYFFLRKNRSASTRINACHLNSQSCTNRMYIQ